MKESKAYFVAFLLAVVFPFTVFAGPVSEAEARQKAQSFLQERNGKALTVNSPLRSRRAPAAQATDGSSYYVFNVGSDEGFVIVSGDDRTPAILGYADSGTLSEDHMPDGLRYLLDGYAEQMEWLEENADNEAYEPAADRAPHKAPARAPIAPLIQTRWDQGEPYNNLCPEIDNKKTVTGCVATTMAQLMYYHKIPTTSPAIPQYSYTAKNSNEQTFKKEVGGLSGTTFDWSNMSLTYSTDATGTAADEVATLMQYCGRSIEMHYGLNINGGSSAYSEAIPFAFKTYFGFDGAIRNTYRKNYSYKEWVDLIYSELAARRPVALGGQSTGGGHSFVCDGYQGDDYFHINWGWGGGSDGYFRLSALNPYEQGIGGSSTLDGFSFSQNAIIGIQPPVAGNKDYCLSLEGLCIGDNTHSAQNTVTFSRDADTEDFNGISFFYVVYNYHYGTNNFDYAIQLVDGSGNLVHTLNEVTNQQMTWNKTNPVQNVNGCSIPSAVSDGTYYIKVVSRPAGTTEWQECFDGDRYQMTAVINGNTLTINVPIAQKVIPTTATMTVAGNLTKGYEQEVTASITGGSADYHGDVVLRVNSTSVIGKTLDIPAGQTVEAHYTFIPTEAGKNTLELYTARTGGTKIGETAIVNVAESDATDNIDNLGFTATIENLNANGQLYGNALRATITVSNPSTTNTYVGQMNCSVRKWTITTTDNGDNTNTMSASWNSVEVTHYPLTVDKEGTTTIAIASDALAPTDENTCYSVRITYRNSAVDGGVVNGIHLGLDENGWGSLTVTNGYRIGSADGTVTIHEAGSAINADDACFVDMTGLDFTDNVSVTPSSNPNCLYLLAEGADTPNGLSDKNVVVGTTAESITLTDGNDFYSPIDFTAQNISYTRTFSRAATSTGGWNGLYLPFDVTAVTCDGSIIDWFHSESDTGKNFWLKTMTGDDNGTVYFDFTDELKANTPYIIALPGSDFGNYQLTGKPVTFTGSNAQIKATATGTLSGNSYKFCGSTVGQSHSDAYMLNTTGTSFIKGNATLPAFRTWIEAVNISSLSRKQLAIGEGEIQGIQEMEDGKLKKEDENGALYTLDGRRVNCPSVSKKGLYIRNGKKIIIR